MITRSHRAAINGLLVWCGPSTIARFVIAVVVNAIQTRSWRRVPHVCVKIVKRLPAGRVRNAATAVVRIRHTVGVVASCLHSYPDAIRSSSVQSVFCRTRNRVFAVKAAARFCQTFYESLTANGHFTTAFAHAKPSGSTDIANGCQSAINLSRLVKSDTSARLRFARKQANCPNDSFRSALALADPALIISVGWRLPERNQASESRTNNHDGGFHGVTRKVGTWLQ